MGNPPKIIALSPRGIRAPPPNTWLFESIRVHNPNGISINSAVLWGTNRQAHTHRQTTLHTCSKVPHLCTVRMRCGLMLALITNRYGRDIETKTFRNSDKISSLDKITSVTAGRFLLRCSAHVPSELQPPLQIFRK